MCQIGIIDVALGENINVGSRTFVQCLAAGFDVGTIGVEVLRNRNQLSTGKNSGHAGQQFEQVVDCSSSGRVAPELLADAD
jgi:hypothetical protein